MVLDRSWNGRENKKGTLWITKTIIPHNNHLAQAIISICKPLSQLKCVTKIIIDI
jgi:hypothetical protein